MPRAKAVSDFRKFIVVESHGPRVLLIDSLFLEIVRSRLVSCGLIVHTVEEFEDIIVRLTVMRGLTRQRTLIVEAEAITKKPRFTSELPVFLLSHSPEQMTCIITSCKTR